MRRTALTLMVAMALVGCRGGTAPQELAHLRERVSTLEAENAHLRGQAGLMEFERDQLREQVNQLSAEANRLRGSRAPENAAVAVGESLAVMPNQVRPGGWISVYFRNLPTRFLPQAGVALRSPDGQNVQVIASLSAANVFLLTIPRDAPPGLYQVVLGEKGVPVGAGIDDSVAITVMAP